jgi:uncharacterized protein (TIGR03083 family)
MTDIWPTIHTERQALADDLAALSAEQWQSPSWCEHWTVHDVLAHLTSAAKMTPPKFVSRFASAGFTFDKFAGREVAREGSGGPAATLAEFRRVRSRSSAPPGPKDTWLGEAFVHGEDIRRPLGIAHDYPLPYVTRVIAMYAHSNAIIGGKSRVSGLELHATDTDFSVGAGPVVEGRAVDLMLAASGRKQALTGLTGPGVDTLAGRP